jgi:hypothetical protein
MTKSEKAVFVNQLVDSVKDGILRAITEDRVPAEWDGFELRQLLADRFYGESFNLAPARKRAYKDACLVNNLT